jgi:hypothetical protein
MAVDLNNISQIPGNECLGDSRDRINYNIDLLKEAIKEIENPVLSSAFITSLSASNLALGSNITLTGNTTTAISVTADNTFIEVVVGGATKYLRLFNI